MRKVYLDSASTTYVNNQVLQEMMPVYSSVYGNSSSLHSFGRDALNLLDDARAKVAKSIGAKTNEIYFTSGGTESNNWAIIGLARANRDKGNHIITSQIEHSSILDACKQLEKEGFEVTYLPVDKNGFVKLEALLHAMKKETILVSIMAANNEVGTIQNLNAIARSVKERGVLFHTDAVSAYSQMNLDVNQLPIDAMSISAHKIYGPKGIGALYVKKGVKIDSFIVGGNQEYGKRAGTTNVAEAVGFGKAAELATKDITLNAQKSKRIRDYFTKEVTEKIEHVHLNGHLIQRLPNIVNLSFEFCERESLLLMLDMAGIAVSTGSACTSGSLEPSHVLKAMGLPNELSHTALRFSFPKNVSKEDIDYVVEELVKAVKKLREISPLNKSVVKEDK